MNKETVILAGRIIFANEGGYSSVNADDNGAVSVGRLQWHGTRALRLLKKIIKERGEGGCLSLITPELYREIESSSSWSARTVSTYEKLQLVSLLSTAESRRVQDAQAYSDVEGYLAHAETLGVEEQSAQIFLADIENQGGAGASSRIVKNANGKDIDALFLSASKDKVFSRYMTRRERVYALLCGHEYGKEPTGKKLYEVREGDTLSRIAREYSTTVRAIAEENQIKNPNLIRVGQLLRIPTPENPGTPENPDTAETPDTPDTAEARVHTVVRGETLSALALLYGVSIADILRENRQKYRSMTADYIVVGWELVIPKGDG